MGFIGNVITAPVGIADVQEALGDGRNDLGQLCKSNNLKMWAKFRPVECKTSGGQNIIGQLTEGGTQSDRARVNYGIGNIPVWTGRDIGKVVAYWIEGTVGNNGANLPNGYSNQPTDGWWTMIKPTSVFRLSDFVSQQYPNQLGYFPFAEPPIGNIETLSIESGNTGTLVNIIYSMGLSGVSEGLTITYGDLSAFNNINFDTSTYFGVVIKAGDDIYLATHNFKIGNGETEGNSLWSYGAVIRFRIDSSSGDIRDCALNKTPIKVFPVLTSLINYCYDPSLVSGVSAIRKVSPVADASGIFVALQEPEEIILDGVFYVEGTILNLSSYKHKAGSSRLVYYSSNIKCNDPDSTHYFKVDVVLLDSTGTVLNTNTIDKTITAGATVSVNGSIDGAAYYNGADSLRITVRQDTQMDSSPYFTETSKVTVVLNEKSPYIE